MERRSQQRRRVDLQVQVTSVDNPETSASARAFDVSQFGISVSLPYQLRMGCAVRLNINDSVLFGFIAHSEPEGSSFRAGISILQVLIGETALSKILKATLEEAVPEIEWLEALP